MIEGICCICEASFRPVAMKGDKCLSCADLYPKAKSRKDIKNPNENKVETLTENRVKDLIYEKLEEANIKRHECETCGKLFFRKSPAAKYCPVCKEQK